MEVAFVAETASCTFLLDADGVCRWSSLRPDADAASRAAAARCLGAQYVAALDVSVDGVLVSEPKEGRSLVFARVDGGRVSLVRSGPIVAFHRLDEASVPSEPTTSARALEGDASVEPIEEAIEEALAARLPLEPNDDDRDDDRNDDRNDDRFDGRFDGRLELDSVVGTAELDEIEEEEAAIVTAPFSRERSSLIARTRLDAAERAAPTQRAPVTIRAFPAPAAGALSSRRGVLPTRRR